LIDRLPLICIIWTGNEIWNVAVSSVDMLVLNHPSYSIKPGPRDMELFA
jgi:hypothetical protein